MLVLSSGIHLSIWQYYVLIIDNNEGAGHSRLYHACNRPALDSVTASPHGRGLDDIGNGGAAQVVHPLRRSTSPQAAATSRFVKPTYFPITYHLQSGCAIQFMLETERNLVFVEMEKVVADAFSTSQWLMNGRRYSSFVLLAVVLAAEGCATLNPMEVVDCVTYGFDIRPIADERADRFLGKVDVDTARCRGGPKAVRSRERPWVDWQNYWATGDLSSQSWGSADGSGHLAPNGRGIDGALVDLEYQRMEMIKFNLFDNSGTFKQYVQGRGSEVGPLLKDWPEMRLPKGYKGKVYKETGYKKTEQEQDLKTEQEQDLYEAVGGDGKQMCHGDLIRVRTLTGICNDIKNLRMGSTNQPFARNMEFETTFPDLGKNELAKNRHGDRLGPLKPDPQVISRKLFTRVSAECRTKIDPPCYTPDPNFGYKQAPFFNVLAAFWIQFMTHDWFSHLKEGHNDDRKEPMSVGCKTEDASELGCRPHDRIDPAYVAEDKDPEIFKVKDKDEKEKEYLTRAYKTTKNTVTAWWDASQIYGYDEPSLIRVKRDPKDEAKLQMEKPKVKRPGGGEKQGYLPEFEPCDEISRKSRDPINSEWCGQEATAFPDNWSVGLSFFHNVFAREHNEFVRKFRDYKRDKPKEDSGLQRPKKWEANNPTSYEGIPYEEVTGEELFQIARLVVSAEIAKIHTIEWTTQLLYNEPLYQGMNANWDGLFHKYEGVAAAVEKLIKNLGKSDDPQQANLMYSALAAGPGIFGLGSHVYSDSVIFSPDDPNKTDTWSLKNPDHVNGGTNHFGSPFNFPEEFVTVYRLHPLVPDLLEYRELKNHDEVVEKIPVDEVVQKIQVVETFRGKATNAMRDRGLANWALSMGRQQLGRLALQNHPQFLQNLPMPPSRTGTSKLDVAALDIIRDRERGVPRFNEFRRQYGLKTLTSFNDFVDKDLEKLVEHLGMLVENETDLVKKAEIDRLRRLKKTELDEQRKIVKTMRQIYGWHTCDESKVITQAQAQTDEDGKILKDENGKPKFINDCLGSKNGTKVDNIEDLDTVVGWLAEPVRPHGFAISETQFQVFILNASRRLFSDRFFTSSFRPEFYTHFGVEWVTNNGPDGRQMEPNKANGHEVEKSPLKRVLLRTMPELAKELEHVVNVFDPWARDRGEFYSLQWKPRPGAESDPAFQSVPNRKRENVPASN